jgi:hypothetical protein
MHIHKDASKTDQQASKTASPVKNRKQQLRDGNAPSSAGDKTVAERNAVDAESAAPVEGNADLLLWALASGIEPEAGWFRAVRLSRRELTALSERHADRFSRLRLLKTIGQITERRHLEVLLKSRLAEMLLSAAGPRELTEISRVLEKLPAARSAETGNDVNSDLDGLELAEAMSEARRLLSELERDPEVKRLLAETSSNGNAANDTEAS